MANNHDIRDKVFFSQPPMTNPSNTLCGGTPGKPAIIDCDCNLQDLVDFGAHSCGKKRCRGCARCQLPATEAQPVAAPAEQVTIVNHCGIHWNKDIETGLYVVAFITMKECATTLETAIARLQQSVVAQANMFGGKCPIPNCTEHPVTPAAEQVVLPPEFYTKVSAMFDGHLNHVPYDKLFKSVISVALEQNIVVSAEEHTATILALAM